MRTYFLTVYDSNGENLLDEKFEANDDKEAKEIGKAKLDEKGYTKTTHRCVSPDGHLVLFNR